MKPPPRFVIPVHHLPRPPPSPLGTPLTNLFPIGNCDFNKKRRWPDTRQRLQ